MPLDTTFAAPRIDLSGVDDLMTQFKTARLQYIRKDALSGLMQGGGEPEFRSAIGKLMSVGDVQGANAITSYYKAAHPELDPYHAAMIDESRQRRHLDELKLKTEYPWLNVGGDEGAPGATPGATTVAQDGQEAPTERPHPMSMAELNADKKYAAGDYQTYLQGGMSEAQHGLKSLEHARDLLKSDPSLSGPTIGIFVKKAMKGEEDVSTWAARKLNPEAFNIAAAHQRAVVASLRPLLGARAAQQLFQSVLHATYDPSADPADNIRRLDLVIDNIRQGAIAKQKEAEYFSTNKTLSGYKGPKFDFENFDPSVGMDDTTVANKTTPSDQPPASPDLNVPPGPGAETVNQGANARWKTPLNPTGNPPTPQDLANLRQWADHPEARQAFDDKFNKGAADFFLGH